MYPCSKCGISKPPEGFYRDTRVVRQHTSECRACRLARCSAVYQRDRDMIQARVRRYRAAHPDKTKAAIASATAKKPQQYRDMKRAWARAHPAQICMNVQRRNARKLQATPAWAENFFIREVYDLAQRRTRITGYKWEVDHIVPLRSNKVCGLHTHTNLQVIPKRDNMIKSNRVWPGMWEV